MTREAAAVQGERRVFLRAYGRSMWPFVPPGAELEVAPLGDRLPAVGAIAVGVRGGHVVAHRVVRVDGGARPPCIVTRGDAFEVDDPPWSPAELVGVVRRASIYGLDVPLEHPAAVALGRSIATNPRAVAAVRGLAEPVARLGRLAAVAAARAVTATGALPVLVTTLGPGDERELDRLLLLHGLDLAAEAEGRGTTVARDLADGRTLGARLAGRLAGAVLPPGRLDRSPADRPTLVVHPFARGSVEGPLLEAARRRGLGHPLPLTPPARWLRALYALTGIGLDERPPPTAPSRRTNPSTAGSP